MSSLHDALDAAVVPLETTDPEADCGDLRRLSDAFADATVVGMGEATHGTHEFFRAKHRLLRFLVEDHGFRLVGLESNFAETRAINDYVVRGEGDPEEALAGIYFWTWNTEEVLATVEWLRGFNADRPEDDRVRFYGFDAQFTTGPASAVEEYLRTVDADLLDANREEATMLAEEGLRATIGDDETDLDARLERANALVATLEEQFEERRDRYVEATSESEWELARRHVRTLAQAVEQQEIRARGDIATGVATRDAHMAENVSWILEFEAPERDRIALWTHNAHAKTGEARAHWGTAETMGQRLRDEYGDDYYALGFEFGRGSFRSCSEPEAEGEEEVEVGEFTIEEPFDGGLADTLSELGRESFLLDFESANSDTRLAEWVEGDHSFHAIGSTYYRDDEKNRRRYVLPDELDGLWYVDETTAAVPVGDGS